ncbi:MAG: hypothetical protein WAV90_14555 [Gordonia amarae]
MKRAIITATAAVLLVVPLTTGCKESIETGASPSNSNILPPKAELGDDGPPQGESSGEPDASTEQSSGAPDTSTEDSSDDSSGAGTDVDKAEIALCQKLSDEQVAELVGKQVQSRNGDCIWNFAGGGDFRVSLSRPTKLSLDTEASLGGAEEIDGAGDRAVNVDKHLYVIAKGWKMDIYGRVLDTDQRKKLAEFLVENLE